MTSPPVAARRLPKLQRFFALDPSISLACRPRLEKLRPRSRPLALQALHALGELGSEQIGAALRAGRWFMGNMTMIARRLCVQTERAARRRLAQLREAGIIATERTFAGLRIRFLIFEASEPSEDDQQKRPPAELSDLPPDMSDPHVACAYWIADKAIARREGSDNAIRNRDKYAKGILKSIAPEDLSAHREHLEAEAQKDAAKERLAQEKRELDDARKERKKALLEYLKSLPRRHRERLRLEAAHANPAAHRILQGRPGSDAAAQAQEIIDRSLLTLLERRQEEEKASPRAPSFLQRLTRKRPVIP